MTIAWSESLLNILTTQLGKKQGSALAQKYIPALPHGYTDQTTPERAALDIVELNQLSEQNPLALKLYYSTDKEPLLHLRLFQWLKPIPLSDTLPMLENLNLRTDSEQPFKLQLNDNKTVWISYFTLIYSGPPLKIDAIKHLFEEAFIKIYFGQVENDGFNKLILSAQLSWREISIIRAYVKYLKQIAYRFSQAYIEKTLIDNANITKQLIDLFAMRLGPKNQSKAGATAPLIEKEILTALDSVKSLDEDKIIRRMLDLIKATLRTNFYQEKEYISIKFDCEKIPELPLPIPLYEVFVYSPRFEAIHLRKTKVARGGIRWSDRLEDFRTEVLGLMKAQVVKNAVIVPSGAKGGFVLKKTTPFMPRDALLAEVVHCYKQFIRGLLDITGNIQNQKYVRPKNVVCYDEYDSYLVVAADKGTAAFSDIANEISKEYHFWLGDAFASGGKTGYDHKKMGITARGAWESIKRHFRELNVDVMSTEITVIGIGDMSGDVFGNGMLYSEKIKLVAAFDHRHIFLDPNPNPKTSFEERKRLFNLPISSWADYNSKLISKGGGVYSRSDKAIALSEEVKIALGISQDKLIPHDLIKAILKAPVDLFFNGGIGTYVKARTETQADVGDRTNDYCRIDGGDLRCKVVGEGGNLGFTQLGRVEYALQGGLINTDSIDNSAGVDCSDHEVNLKILLDSEVSQGRLTEKKRNDLLARNTDAVAALVLKDNYDQALVMSFSAYHAKKNIGLHTNYIKELESLGIINRKVERLPNDKELNERKAAGLGLTRPELAVLLAYSKIHIKDQLLETSLPEDPYLSHLITTAFPPAISKTYEHAMHSHRLHRNIIATQLSNNVVNQMGITFVYRLQMETSASVSEVIRAHAIASHVFGTHELQLLIQSLDYKINVNEQYDMLYNIRNLINLATRWFLRSPHLKQELQGLINHFSTRVKILEDITPSLMAGVTKEYLGNLTSQFIKLGISPEIAKRIATYRAIYTSLNIIEVATKNQFDLRRTAEVYFASGERVNLLWFRDQIASDTREGHWNALARLTLRDALDAAQCDLTVAVIKHDRKEKNSTKLIDNWLKANKRALSRWKRILALMYGSQQVDYTMFFIAIRELAGLIEASQH